MMSKTHLSIGIATAILLSSAETPAQCAVCVSGGALGGVIADVDVLKNDYKSDALKGEAFAFALLALTILLDYFTDKNLISQFINNLTICIIGLICFIILWIIGFFTDHRNFTHSLLAMLLFTVSMSFISVDLAIPFMFGYLSHLLIDILNKKGILLLFPIKCKICFGWCYADKTANSVLMWIGLIIAMAILLLRLFIN